MNSTGRKPDPIVVDAMLAYMMEFRFLPNPSLNKDGTLSEKAPPPARRGETLFQKPFRQMNGMSCADVSHVPASHFVDHQRHDIGSVKGAEDDSLDRALDTPTLLRRAIHRSLLSRRQPGHAQGRGVQWFDRILYGLKLDESQVSDLTAYLETVGDGKEPYEEKP